MECMFVINGVYIVVILLINFLWWKLNDETNDEWASHCDEINEGWSIHCNELNDSWYEYCCNHDIGADKEEDDENE